MGVGWRRFGMLKREGANDTPIENLSVLVANGIVRMCVGVVL